MIGRQNADKILIFLGDLILFYGSLWLALVLRFGAIPTWELYALHVIPFSYLFAAWVLVFYIASMYEPHTVVFKSKIPAILLNVQAVNALIGVMFFYLIPSFGIAPKTILFLDLLVTFVAVSLWRVFGVPLLGLRRKERAVLIGSGEETRKLYRVVNDSSLYPMRFITWVDLEKLDGIDFETEILHRIYSEGVSTVVIDLKNEKVNTILPKLYNLISSHVRFVDQYRIYEDIFDAIPLSLIGYNWFLENVSSRAHFGYDLLKRGMDVFLSLLLLVPTMVVFPFIALAIKLSDGGPVFYTSSRVGQNNRQFVMWKFRSMTGTDQGDEVLKSKHTVTLLGQFLRKSRLDELPQLWNVLTGDLSLIGPRPEFPALVEEYKKQIPHYGLRHLVKPGLSGWAQVHHQEHPHHSADVRETVAKLSYDLYYLKNRSLALDLKIALKTVKTLLSRQGR